MATYLLDTTTFSLVIKEHPKVRAKSVSLAGTDRIVICSIVLGEILYGLELMPVGRKRQAPATKVAGLLARLSCESVPEEAENHYARIKRVTERRGTRLDENDLWIAATALSLDATLVTTDSDFQRVTGLKIETWT